ncbi:MAG: M3 family metallopeptidase [Vicinamibacterales bacterium]|jgi:thimet oligopeptidase
MKLPSSVALVLFGLIATAGQGTHAQTAAIDPASNAPFYTGVTDPESLARLVNGRLAAAREGLDRLTAATGKRSAEQTLRMYDDIQVHIGAARELASIVRQLHPEAAMRTAAETLNQAAEGFETELALNPAAYGALAGIRTTGAPADLKRYLTLELDDYRREGVDKDAATRAKINELRDLLVTLRQEFDRNVREGGRTLTVASAAELAGLPPDFIAAHKPAPDGTIKLTTSASDLQPVMLYAKSDDLRRRMLIESNNIAYPANLAVLQRMVETRAELARTLGFKDWASFDLSNRMAATPQNAAAFIDRIVSASATKANADYQLILDRKKQDQPGATTVDAWQRRYYTELVRQSSFNFDSQAMRPYFSYERVRAGVFAVSGKLFGLEFRPAPGLPVWHPSVEPYEVFDGGRLVARIYLDMHPRPGKGGGGATAATARAGIRGQQLPEVVLICRFPGGEPGDPGLMTYDQVTTFFHEFGHLIHAVSSGRQRWIGLTRVVERDFIEAPSQMMEEWVSDPATLATFATHYQTNAPIPATLVSQMRRANELGRGYDTRQQMVFAGLSLSLHSRDPKSADAMAIYKDLMEKYLPTTYPEGSHFPGTFTQLSNPNYTASYYTYMWSLVIAKDLFSGFDQRDLLAAGPARRFRDTVLAQGGAKPAADLVRDFLGRPFSPAAWVAWLNQATPAPAAP